MHPRKDPVGFVVLVVVIVAALYLLLLTLNGPDPMGTAILLFALILCYWMWRVVVRRRKAAGWYDERSAK